MKEKWNFEVLEWEKAGDFSCIVEYIDPRDLSHHGGGI